MSIEYIKRELWLNKMPLTVVTIADLICDCRFLTPTTEKEERTRIIQEFGEPIENFYGAKDGKIIIENDGSYNGPINKYLTTKFYVNDTNYITGITIGRPKVSEKVTVIIVNTRTHERLAGICIRQTPSKSVSQQIDFKRPVKVTKFSDYILLIRYRNHKNSTVIYHTDEKTETFNRTCGDITYTFKEVSQLLLNIQFMKFK